MECGTCGKEVSTDDAFCSSCGSPLEQQCCPKCHRAWNTDWEFCAGCGSRYELERIPDGVKEQYRVWTRTHSQDGLDRLLGGVKQAFDTGSIDEGDLVDIERVLPDLVATPAYATLVSEYMGGGSAESSTTVAPGADEAPTPRGDRPSHEPTSEADGRRKMLIGIGIAVALILVVLVGSNAACAKNRMQWSLGQNMYGIDDGGRCPLGGTYSWGTDYPSCSIHGELTESEIQSVRASN